MSKVPAVDQNRYHLSIANLAQFRAKFGTGKFFLFVFGQNQKSVQELLYGPVYISGYSSTNFSKKLYIYSVYALNLINMYTK